MTLSIFLDDLARASDIAICARVYALMDTTFRSWTGGDVEPTVWVACMVGVHTLEIHTKNNIYTRVLPHSSFVLTDW